MTHAIGIERATAWFDREFNGLPDTASLVTGIVAEYLAALKPSGDAGEVASTLVRIAESREAVLGRTQSACLRDAASTITTLERQLATVREALEPFAAKMDWPISDRDAGRQVFCDLTGMGSGASFGLEVDDFRRARSALTQTDGEGKPK